MGTDLFTVGTVSLKRLYGLFVIELSTRGVTVLGDRTAPAPSLLVAIGTYRVPQGRRAGRTHGDRS